MLELLAICAPWMPSGFAVVRAGRRRTDCFDLRDLVGYEVGGEAIAIGRAG